MGNIDILSIDWSNIVFTIINLLIFYFLLKKFLFKPIFRILDERQEKLDKTNKEAADAKSEALQMKNHDEAISNADEESSKIIESAKEKAREKYEQIVVSAQGESDRLLADAHKSIELEKKKALHDAKSDIADLAVSVAEKVIGNNTGIENDNAIYDEFFAQVGDDNDNDTDNK